MRLHLLYPDVATNYHPGIHHGVAALAASLRIAGHDISVTRIGERVRPELLIETVTASGADVIGFTIMSNQFKFLKFYAPHLWKALHKPIVVGGVHATIAPRECLDVEGVSCACRGDGDDFIVSFLNMVSSGSDWRTLPGVAFLDGNNLVSIPGLKARLLDSLPAPDYSDFDMERILRDFGGRLSVVVSRGCPYACSYCSNHALRVASPESYGASRFRSPRNAVETVATLVTRYNPRSINFVDDLLVLRQSWTKEFLDLFKTHVGLPFECNCRADLVTPQLVEQLRVAGCISVSIGVECGDEKYRNTMLRKSVSNEDYRRAFPLLHAAGIRTYAFNIMGLPFETERHVEATFELNREIQPSAGNVFYFFPYPGTELGDAAKRAGALRPDYDQVCSYLERPTITEEFVSYRKLRKFYRRLRMYLLLRRLETSFVGPRFIRELVSKSGWLVFRLCPPIVDWITNSNSLKRALRAVSLFVTAAPDRARPNPPLRGQWASHAKAQG